MRVLQQNSDAVPAGTIMQQLRQNRWPFLTLKLGLAERQNFTVCSPLLYLDLGGTR
jgi:hypothetical protein